MEKILVIDDEPIIRESITAYLEDSGFRVCQARDGREGLTVFRREQPDLVMVDLRMPGIDGLEVLSTVMTESPDTPTLVVSGTGVIQDAIEALRMGALDFVTKPILDMAVLEHAAKKALERARLRVENRHYREHLEEEIRCRTAELVKRTRELQESETKLSAIIELFEGMIYTSTQDFRIEFMNRKLMDHIGRNATGEKCHTALFDLASPCPWCVNKNVFKGETTRWEIQNPRDNRWYYGINTPIFGSDGQIFMAQSIAMDITDRKHAEEALQEREVRLREENTRLRSSLKGSGQFGRIIGKCATMQKVYETILKAAQADVGVIIYGESGTGKELVAQTIHELSQRGSGPFVTVNCGAIPDTLIESEFFGYKKGAFTGAITDKPGFLDLAHKGTLFLDEVGEIPLSLQVKLLRAIEGGGYTPVGGDKLVKADFRVVAATHRDLRKRVEQQKMRQDFYYRIHLIPISLPPLRQRKEDLPQLVQHFLNTIGHGNFLQALPESVMRAIHRYDWPGNVRELQNVIQRYVTLREIDLPLAQDPANPSETVSLIPSIRDNAFIPLAEALNDAEKSVIMQCLHAHQWKRGRVAQVLGIDRRTLFRKMKSHGLF
ncbi:MAG: sigma 54-interacting transcriptional regulator [Pseudomonadota bacterium]